jgi:glycosyltransferase involved in cell wall biosynthesis
VRVRRVASRRPHHDVVFYAPYIGWMLSTPGSASSGEAETWGGAERQTLSLALALAARGARVAIVAFDGAPNARAKLDGVRIITRPMRAGGGGLRGKVTETIRIWRAVWTARPRAIVHRGGASLEVGLLAVYARMTRRRFIFASANVADFDYGKLESNRLYRGLYELGVRLAHTVVVQTAEQARLCEARFGRKPQLISSIAPSVELGDDAADAFLWVGRLKWYKRPLEYVALARAVPEATFWMVGVPSPYGESDRAVSQAVRREAQDVPNLVLLPPQGHADLQLLMARAVASVSTSQFEGMPNVLLEAWSKGVPALVFSYDPDGVVTRHGLGLFADGSRERFVALARELWNAREDRAELAERCRTYVRTHHAREVIAHRWLGVVSGTAIPRSAESDDGGAASGDSTTSLCQSSSWISVHRR